MPASSRSPIRTASDPAHALSSGAGGAIRRLPLFLCASPARHVRWRLHSRPAARVAGATTVAIHHLPILQPLLSERRRVIIGGASCLDPERADVSVKPNGQQSCRRPAPSPEQPPAFLAAPTARSQGCASLARRRSPMYVTPGGLHAGVR